MATFELPTGLYAGEENVVDEKFYKVEGILDRCPPYLKKELGGRSFAEYKSYTEYITAVEAKHKRMWMLANSGQSPISRATGSQSIPSATSSSMPTSASALQKQWVPFFERMEPLKDAFPRVKDDGTRHFAKLHLLQWCQRRKRPAAFFCYLCFEQNLPRSRCVMIGTCDIEKDSYRFHNQKSHLRSCHPNDLQKSLSEQDRRAKRQRTYFDKVEEVSDSIKLKRVHLAISKMQTALALPLSFCSSDHLTEAFQEATRLKSGSFKKLTRHGTKNILETRLDQMFCNFRVLFDRCRAYFARDLKDDVPSGSKLRSFATGMHDGWESKLRCGFGSSFVLIDPDTWELRKAAFGLALLWDKSSQAAAECFYASGRQFGLLEADIYDAVSDTTNSALKASRIIVAGESGDQDAVEESKCFMHVASLALEHAIGLRSRSGETISFSAGKDLFHKMNAIVSFIQGGHRKERAEKEYKEAQDPGMQTIRFHALSTTRIGYIHILIQDFIRSYFCLDNYFRSKNEEDQSIMLTPREWQLLVEFESVMRSVVQLAMTSQVDLTCSASMSWLRVIETKMKVLRNEFIVASPFNGVKYDAKTQMKEILAVRSKRMTRDRINNDLPHLQPETCQLLDRLETELDRYFVKPTVNGLLAMALDPIVWLTGRTFIESHHDSSDLWKDLEDELEAAYKAEKAGMKFSEAQPPAQGDSETLVSHNEDSVDSWEAEMIINGGAHSSSQPQGHEGHGLSNNSDIDELEKWKNLSNFLNWEQIILQQQGVDFVIQRNRLRSPYYLSKVVDSLKVWKTHLVPQFPVLHRIALRVLGTPDSNGFQERVFSHASTINSVRRLSLLPESFELLTLLKVNHQWHDSDKYEAQPASSSTIVIDDEQ